jgi:hypothetical protein
MQSHKTIENLKSAFVSKSLISDFLKGGVDQAKLQNSSLSCGILQLLKKYLRRELKVVHLL